MLEWIIRIVTIADKEVRIIAIKAIIIKRELAIIKREIAIIETTTGITIGMRIIIMTTATITMAIMTMKIELNMSEKIRVKQETKILTGITSLTWHQTMMVEIKEAIGDQNQIQISRRQHAQNLRTSNNSSSRMKGLEIKSRTHLTERVSWV